MKLNKSQISAIASKIKNERDKEILMEQKADAKKYMADAIKIIALEKQNAANDKRISAIKGKYIGYMTHNERTKPEDLALEMAKKKDNTINPSVQSIEEALIIASVDANDMDQLMKNYKKFLI